MAAPAVVEINVQKTDADCGISALASLIQKPYAEVSEHAIRMFPKPHKSGLWTTEIIALAKSFGITLKKGTIKDDEPQTGLGIMRKRNGESHVVLLFQGVLVDPANGLLYDYTTYVATTGYKPRGFLEM